MTQRRIFGILGLLALLLLSIAASIFIGTRAISPAEVFATLTQHPEGSDLAAIIFDQRIPRTILAMVVGAAMAISGTLVQGVTRNPLADPGILGITAGAVLFIVSGTYFLHTTGMITQVWLALLGGLLAALAVFGVSAAVGASHGPASLVLVGAAITALSSAITTAIILKDQRSLNEYRFWTAGSVVGRDLDSLAIVAPPLCFAALLALSCGPTLNALGVGEEMARSLGINVNRARLLILGAAVVLAAGAASVAGPLTFVGLIVPHILRPIFGPDHRWLLILAPIAGACLVLIADVLGRLIIRPAELQVGIVLAFVGVPVFIAIIRRRSLVSL